MNAKKGFAPLILLIIFAVVAIGGGTYIYSKKKKTADVNSNIQATSTVETTSSTSSGPISSQPTTSSNSNTANWKTYINSKYGFEFKYPLKYGQIKAENQVAVGIGLARQEVIFSARTNIENSNNILINVVSDETFKFSNTGGYELKFDKQKGECSSNDEVKTNNLKFNGWKGCYISDSDGGFGTIGYVFPDKNNSKIIVIQIVHSGLFVESKKEINSIIETFKFSSPQTTKSSSSGENTQPFNWYGKYEFGEVVPANLGGGSVQSWQYNLSISSSNGASRWIVGFDVDGFQTLLRVNATANNVGKSLDIVFDSYDSPDSMQLGYKKGDVLFTLTPATTGLLIQWKKMQPNIQASLNGSVFTRVSTEVNNTNISKNIVGS